MIILREGDALLRQPCRQVHDVAEVAQLADAMIATMQAARGIGLAAPQVGHMVRVVVIGAGAWRKFPRVLINPVVTAVGNKQELETEGCLSLGDQRCPVRRAAKIYVEALSAHGKPMSFNASGIIARCIQHEVDHLNGVLITDRRAA